MLLFFSFFSYHYFDCWFIHIMRFHHRSLSSSSSTLTYDNRLVIKQSTKSLWIVLFTRYSLFSFLFRSNESLVVWASSAKHQSEYMISFIFSNCVNSFRLLLQIWFLLFESFVISSAKHLCCFLSLFDRHSFLYWSLCRFFLLYIAALTFLILIMFTCFAC